MALVYLGLGSNLGDREANLAAARHGLAVLPQTRLDATASTYKTKPVGGPSGQGDFLNSACRIDTALSPKKLLREIHRLEREIGRHRENETARWGPRLIDIDILFWEGVTMDEPDLTIPHPRLAEREFALRPLADLQPDFTLSPTGLTVRQLLERIDRDNERVQRLPL